MILKRNEWTGLKRIPNKKYFQRSLKTFQRHKDAYFVWPRNITDFIYHIYQYLHYYKFQKLLKTETSFHVCTMEPLGDDFFYAHIFVSNFMVIKYIFIWMIFFLFYFILNCRFFITWPVNQLEITSSDVNKVESIYLFILFIYSLLNSLTVDIFVPKLYKDLD